MSYELKFLPVALREWKKLSSTTREQFKKKLAQRLINPYIPSAKLSGEHNLYKIKLRSSGYRLAYQVIDEEVVVIVLSVGRREKSMVYEKMKNRLK